VCAAAAALLALTLATVAPTPSAAVESTSGYQQRGGLLRQTTPFRVQPRLADGNWSHNEGSYASSRHSPPPLEEVRASARSPTGRLQTPFGRFARGYMLCCGDRTHAADGASDGVVQEGVAASRDVGAHLSQTTSEAAGGACRLGLDALRREIATAEPAAGG
jgi:hypothetical protein